MGSSKPDYIPLEHKLSNPTTKFEVQYLRLFKDRMEAQKF